MMAKVNEAAMTDLLQQMLNAAGDCDCSSDGCRAGENAIEMDEVDEDEVLPGCQVRSFEECGVLTRNHGLVLRLSDGSEFQITIVRSR